MTTGVVTRSRQGGAARRVVIVVNELAPQAGVARWRERFAAAFGPSVEVIEVRVRHFHGAEAAARGAAAWGAELVIAVGGDGTVNACVNGIGASDTRIAVVPAGTANDLANLMGCTARAADAADIDDWRRRDIDAIEVDGTRFYSVGGLGFAADVAATANRWRSVNPLARWLLGRLGSLIYTLACVLVILLQRRLGARMSIRYTDAETGEEKVVDREAYGLLVANCNRVGKSFQLAPVSNMHDGVFELILFPKTTRLRLLKTVLLAQKGRLFDVPEMRWIQVTRAQVTCDRALEFFGDGETLTRTARVELAIASTPVRLMTPVAAEVAASYGLAAAPEAA